MDHPSARVLLHAMLVVSVASVEASEAAATASVLKTKELLKEVFGKGSRGQDPQQRLVHIPAEMPALAVAAGQRASKGRPGQRDARMVQTFPSSSLVRCGRRLREGHRLQSGSAALSSAGSSCLPTGRQL